MKKKVAIIFEGDAFDRKGLFNAVSGRAASLAALGGRQVDLFCIQCRDNFLSRLKRKTVKGDPDVREVETAGMKCSLLWYRFSFIDWLLVEKLHRRPFFFTRFVRRNAKAFSGYDIVSAHSFSGGIFAREVKARFGTPFCVSWHGSDIHTIPRRNPLIRRETAFLMQEADRNFFVSEALLRQSGEIGPGRGKEVLRNGIGPEFRVLSGQERTAARSGLGICDDSKVVAFVGSVFKVKNPGSLPGIFHKVREAFEGPLVFLVVGDGKAMGELRPALEADTTLDCRFLGNRPAGEMPRIMNAIDVLVLPSLNEGLPLVPMEALSCGAAVVGSRVGGVPEIIGEENTVPLGDGFEEEFARKVVAKLLAPSPSVEPGMFGWEKTSLREAEALDNV